MGLDVCAVTKYEIVKNPTDEQKEELCELCQPSDFIGHLGDSLNDGDYIKEIECGGEYRSSYGRHGHFREFLASLVYECVQVEKPSCSDPDFMSKFYQHQFPHVHGMYQTETLSLHDDFVAIIHFSDCEGVIGNELCKILNVAFCKHIDKAKDSDWFGQYKAMAECVKLAAESGGYLDFH